jgi:hypothetical protein
MGALAAAVLLVGLLLVVAAGIYRLWHAGMRRTQPLLMHRVFAQEGVSLEGCNDPSVLRRMGLATRTCLLCRDQATCLVWLDGSESRPVRDFCPNSDLIAQLKEKAVRPVAVRG